MIAVTHFQRKSHPTGNFSVEFIFADVRHRLQDKISFRVKQAHWHSTGLFKRIGNAIEAIFYQADINHVTGDIHYITFFLVKRKTILTILDCGFLNHGNKLKRFIYKIVWLTIPAKRVSYITAISDATKSAILEHVNINPERIVVIPVAVSLDFKPFPKRFNSEYPRLLQVGTASNKNLERLIPALFEISCRLVIIGKIDDKIKSLLLTYRIDYENKWNLTNEEIIEEYRQCDMLTFASTYEGFGMPIIEANSVERPVVAGNNTSMIEVASNAACLVDASSIEDIRKGVLRVIKDDDYREMLIANGRVNRLRFDPHQIAKAYCQLYQKVHRRNRS